MGFAKRYDVLIFFRGAQTASKPLQTCVCFFPFIFFNETYGKPSGFRIPWFWIHHSFTSARDPGSPSENGFMKPKYYAFQVGDWTSLCSSFENMTIDS